jgi:hypothetical protein
MLRQQQDSTGYGVVFGLGDYRAYGADVSGRVVGGLVALKGPHDEFVSAYVLTH